MTLTLLNVIYVLLAVAMIGFILVQRGAGAQAGSGFGSGASATVFGARGASNFLTKSTAILATSFFVISLGMGIYISHGGGTKKGSDLGVMSEETVPAAPVQAPAAPASDVPAAAKPNPSNDVPAATLQAPQAPQPAKDAKPEEGKK